MLDFFALLHVRIELLSELYVQRALIQSGHTPLDTFTSRRPTRQLCLSQYNRPAVARISLLTPSLLSCFDQPGVDSAKTTKVIDAL